MKSKKSQIITVWFLPLIVIGGIFYPALGYLVAGMMAFFIPLSFFTSRYWCWNMCPRGAFLDMVMPKASRNKPTPRIFARGWFRWSILALLMGFLIFRMMKAGVNLLAIGAVFVTMCIITTAASIILAVMMKPRAWCAICPMGTLQEHIGKIRKKKDGR